MDFRDFEQAGLLLVRVIIHCFSGVEVSALPVLVKAQESHKTELRSDARAVNNTPGHLNS